MPTRPPNTATSPRRPPPAQRSWRGVPIDARRTERRELLVSAAFDIVGNEGAGALTVRRACEVARLNARYFYESFDSVASLLVALYDALAAESLRRAVTAAHAAGGEPEAQARAVIAAVVHFVADDPRRGRILFSEGLGMEAVAQRRRDAMLALAQFIERSTWRTTGLAEDRIGMVAALILTGGLTELIATWLGGHLDLTVDELVDDATALLFTLGRQAVQTAQGRRAGPRTVRPASPSP